MSHKSVEIIIGRLATDEELRARFRDDPAGTLRDLAGAGLPLTETELVAVLACGLCFVDAAATAIDPRLVKASLRTDVRPDTRPLPPSIA